MTDIIHPSCGQTCDEQVHVGLPAGLRPGWFHCDFGNKYTVLFALSIQSSIVEGIQVIMIIVLYKNYDIFSTNERTIGLNQSGLAVCIFSDMSY